VLINGGRIALEADIAELVSKRSLEEEYLRHVSGEAGYGAASRSDGGTAASHLTGGGAASGGATHA
jgi:hypothetical protein